jgi:hypothetical protein
MAAAIVLLFLPCSISLLSKQRPTTKEKNQTRFLNPKKPNDFTKFQKVSDAFRAGALVEINRRSPAPSS